MGQPTYIFAGGGTGGHLYPGLAVTEQLLRTDPSARVVFACSRRPLDRRILGPTDHGIVVQPVLPVPRGARGWERFLYGWVASTRLAGRLLSDLQPAAVLGLGGFAAGPVVRVAAKRGVRTALLNPDAVPGLANRYLARRVQTIFTQFEQTREAFAPGLREKVRRVGCPVRRDLLGGSRDRAVERFALRPDRKTLLVLGGSSGAASINRTLGVLAEDLGRYGSSWQVLHVTGSARAGEGAPETDAISMVRLDYCDRMDLAYAAADLVLARAGAVTLAELGATATPAVLVPYPYHRDQHQLANARAFARAGGARVVEDRADPEATAATLRGVLLPLMADQAKLGEMARSAGRAGSGNAAQEVAAWLSG